MRVTRAEIIRRGLSNRCPNCGQPTLFPPRSFRIRPRCPNCGTGFDRGEGFFLGPFVLNYTASAVVFVIPPIILAVRGTLPWPPAIAVAIIGCAVVPILLYRRTWGWWLMLYFYFLPHLLPANGGAIGEAADD